MTMNPVIPIFQTPKDIALKLFHEAGRTWNASNLEKMGDHLFNFCVTNLASRDWLRQFKSKKGMHHFIVPGGEKAEGLFGECADIANASKHLLVKIVSVTTEPQHLAALGPYGVISGQEKDREALNIIFSDGRSFELLLFFQNMQGMGRAIKE